MLGLVSAKAHKLTRQDKCIADLAGFVFNFAGIAVKSFVDSLSH